MEKDKIFYATWGLVIIFIGLSAIIGMLLSLDIVGIFLVWLFLVGALLVIVGGISIRNNRSTALLQIGTGMVLVLVSAGSLAVFLEVLDVYVTIALIIIFMGIGIVAIGMSKKR